MFFQKTETIIIAGASRFGAAIAESLSGRNTRIVVIDLKKEAFRRLPDDFNGYQVVGDGTDTGLLKQLGIEQARIFIAATEDDNVNIFAAQIASSIYKVPRVFLKLNDKNKEKLIEGLPIQSICPFALSVHEFDRLIKKEYQEVSAV